MRRVFAPLAWAAAALALWVLVAGPAAGPIIGSARPLPQPPAVYTAWAVGLLMGLCLAWLATRDWGEFRQWLGLQRNRLGLLLLGGVAASMLLLL